MIYSLFSANAAALKDKKNVGVINIIWTQFKDAHSQTTILSNNLLES